MWYVESDTQITTRVFGLTRPEIQRPQDWVCGVFMGGSFARGSRRPDARNVWRHCTDYDRTRRLAIMPVLYNMSYTSREENTPSDVNPLN